MRKLKVKTKALREGRVGRCPYRSWLLVGRVISYGAVGIFGLIMLALFFPIVNSSSSALDNTTAYAESRVSVKAAASVAVSMARQVDIEVVPKSTGTFGYNSMRLGVSTNNEEGYQIFLTTSDGSDTLKNTDSSKTGSMYEISSIVQDTPGTSFAGNTWGYALSREGISEQTIYSGVPTSTTSIYNTTSAPVNEEDVYSLGFGAHISTTLPAGEYSNSVIVSVIANPIKITSLNQLVYMQDMQPELCANTAEGVTKQLYDIRDGKRYWVAKLKDGNCWMVQNLALDLSTDKALTPEDSDVSESWVPSSSTEREVPAPDENWNAGSVGSWNLGDIVLVNPTGSVLCPQQGVPNDGYIYPNPDKYSTVFHGQNITETCSEYYKDVTGLVDSYLATETSAISPDAESYDAHYLIGNYYSWGAVSAGSNSGLSSPTSANTNVDDLVDASSSICPKGWRLPVSGRYYDGNVAYPFERVDSFMNLLMAYGYPAGDVSAGWRVSNGSPLTSMVDRTRVDYMPLYFVKNGSINPRFGAIRSAGASGNVSSATLSSDSQVLFIFNFDNYNVFPSSRSTEYVAGAVRCIAR